MTTRAPRSLRSKALQLLAQREQSRVELRRKLLAHVRAIDEAGDTPVGAFAVGVIQASRADLGVRQAGEVAVGAIQANDADVGERGAGEGNVCELGAGGAKVGRPEVARTEAGDAATPGAGAPIEASPESRVDEVIAWLEAHGFLSEDRFTESRIHARAGRYGDLRIRQELKQHGIALAPEAARHLRDSEAARAWTVWERRFGVRPADAADRAKQARFLGGRGFSSQAVSQVLRRAAEVPDAPRGSLAADELDEPT